MMLLKQVTIIMYVLNRRKTVLKDRLLSSEICVYSFHSMSQHLLHYRLISRGLLYICSFRVGLRRKFASFHIDAVWLLLF